jgi:vacuolar protein sorting-associated protein 54
LREAKLFEEKLGGIDGAGNVGTYLFGLVVAKQVARPAQPAQPAQPRVEAESKKSEEADEKGMGKGNAS